MVQAIGDNLEAGGLNWVSGYERLYRSSLFSAQFFYKTKIASKIKFLNLKKANDYEYS